ncbi:MAG: hypothetical protein C4341_02625 [Armatimonadota bacterium]
MGRGGCCSQDDPGVPRVSPKVELLLALQERAFRTSPWHSLLNSLDGVPDDVFVRAPEKHSGFPWMDGSIRDIVYHVTGDKVVQLSHAFGDGSVTWESVKVARASLGSMVEQLLEAHAHLAETLKQQSDESLGNKVRTWGGKTMTACDFFLMLVEHDVYHAGQIRMLRNLYEV